MKIRHVLSAVALTLVPLTVHAQANDAPSTAKNVLLGGVTEDTLGAAAPDDQNWFRYSVRTGRSYCVEVDNGEADNTFRDTLLTVYRTDATTVVGSNNTITDEPSVSILSRVCYIAVVPLFSEEQFAVVTRPMAPAGVTGKFRIRVVETTLFSPWFFSGSGFEAFVLIRNTTVVPRSATVTLYDPAGTILGTQSGTVPSNGSLNLQVSAAPPTGFGLASAAGGLQITHNGPPGVLVANVTSLNFGSGVSFDTPVTPRQDFR